MNRAFNRPGAFDAQICPWRAGQAIVLGEVTRWQRRSIGHFFRKRRRSPRLSGGLTYANVGVAAHRARCDHAAFRSPVDVEAPRRSPRA